jgi:2-methylcitrate synthase
MNETPAAFKPKKSVALSGVTAGNTALCTVGRTGNDLHYRGYDILEIATAAEFEEIAYLLIHEHLPTRAELASYKAKLKSLRGIPLVVRQALEALPAATHPMDVMRTTASPGSASWWRPRMTRSAGTSCTCCTAARRRPPGCAPCTPP